MPAQPESCDCPACSGGDPEQTLRELAEGLAALVGGGSGLEAELAGAAMLVMMAGGDEELLAVLVERVIPDLESGGSPGTLALLLAIGSISAGEYEETARTASAAAARLVARGVPKPQWADELAEPVRVGDCLRLYDSTISVLAGSFSRAGEGHAFVVFVDEEHCGAAMEVMVVDSKGLPSVLADVRERFNVRTRSLTPAEFRWYVEEAFDARAAHDLEEPDFDASDDDDEGPPYPVLALLLRSRLAGLPSPRRPAGARAAGHQPTDAASLLRVLESLAGLSPRGSWDPLALAQRTPARLPAKRKKSDGPAPVYQLKVRLVGSKPPIWRRLLVPASVSLARLHTIIQMAFNWQGGHLHVFETPFGEFGKPDPELGHRNESPVTLEQVALRVKDRIRYTYDFGDDWEHDILVEQVLPPDPSLTYPRCTGGRRAAPPEDCGGVWGYQELVQILADPAHPEHSDRLSWLGLDDPAELDPAAFDVDEVNSALALLR